MNRDLNDGETAHVFGLPFPARYEYFIQHVGTSGRAWSLADSRGWVLMGDEYGREYVPVWPGPRFAAACSGGIWVGTEPRPIELEEWRQKWLPGMAADGLLPAVFPTPAGRAIAVEPHELDRNLVQELCGGPGGEEKASINGGSAPEPLIDQESKP